MKISPNLPCLCKSGKKYKKCCKPYHDGIFPIEAEELMRSRFCAFASKKADYIINTTHSENSDFTSNIQAWTNDIINFCEATDFDNLEILETIDGELESFVSFRVTLKQDSLDASFTEKSRFLKVEGKWFYVDGTFLD